MGWPKWTGYAVFILVPFLLLAIATMFTRAGSFSAGALSFIAGSDNRLSLSRLQALVWTLVIFGSFAAAMAIHTTIVAGSQDEIDNANADAKSLTERTKSLKAAVEKAESESQSAAEAKDNAEKAANEAEAYAKVLIASVPPNAGAADAQNKALHARAAYQVKADLKTKADKNLAEATSAWSKAESGATAADTKARGYGWVAIPAALLALAGIAIGSGVFSSLISSINGEQKTSCVTAITTIPASNLKSLFPDAATPAFQDCLQIIGRDMDKTGQVRLGKGIFQKDYVSVLFWKDDGTTIVLDVPDNEPYRMLVVDTANGKLCYTLSGTMPNLTLGPPKHYYEFVDLFRDDKNPRELSLMKFQMFGWTFLAVVIYVYLFITDLRANTASLPIIPQDIVILTGLSQAGYLSAKGISNVGSSEKK